MIRNLTGSDVVILARFPVDDDNIKILDWESASGKAMMKKVRIGSDISEVIIEGDPDDSIYMRMMFLNNIILVEYHDGVWMVIE